MAEDNTPSRIDVKFVYVYLPVIIISIFGAVSNVLLLVAFIKDPLKCFRNSGTYLVINLSVSDCLVCFLHLFSFWAEACLVVHFLERWWPAVSLISITCISIDRFLIVAYPIKHRALIKGKVVVLWLAAIWTVSFVVLASALFSEISMLIRESVFLIFSIMIMILSSALYLFTCCKLKKQSRNIALQNSTGGRAQELRNLKEKRFFKTIIIIAFIAFVFTLPVLVFFFINTFLRLRDYIMAPDIVFMLLRFLFQINFAVNPLMYFMRLPNYRKAFYAIYCRRTTASN